MRDYGFPEQETRLKPGQLPTAPLADPYVVLTLAALDRRARRATVRIGADKDIGLPERLSLHPPKPLPTKGLAAAVRAVIADQSGPRAYRALDDLLARRPPRLDGGPVADILGGADPVEGTVRAVLAMQGTVLPIQGPPGTGKTHVAARAILALVAAGRRVAVAATSHEAIANLLRACLAALPDDATGLAIETVALAHKLGVGDSPWPAGSPVHAASGPGDPAWRTADVVGGTAFHFCKPEFEGAFDTLVVDEAGQVGLANLLAMGRCARNIVLVGDPRQLPQVVQGAHPGAAGVSCLDWLLGEEATVPPDRGILLPVTRRMHPDLCRFVSDRVYDGRLASHPDCARQRIGGTRWPATGAHLVPVPHAGNAQVAHAEVAAIRAAIADLTRGTWTDAAGIDPAAARVRHHRRCPLQCPGERAPRRPAGAGAGRDGRQVPGAGGAGLPRLDDRVVDRGRAARHGVPVLAQPHQRRGLARPGAGAGLRLAAPARRPVRQRGGGAAGRHALRAAGGRPGRRRRRRRLRLAEVQVMVRVANPVAPTATATGHSPVDGCR